MIYVDSSALLKLLHEESESLALRDWLSARPDVPVISSELVRVEVIRACRRIDADTLPAAGELLRALDVIPLSTDLLEAASSVGAVTLRSLDAIHLASALAVREGLSAFVGYDQRLLQAASEAGLPGLSPGR